jgi:ribosome-associated protein
MAEETEKDSTVARGLAVRPGLVLPEGELVMRASRSGGPGGQNVNKVSTRIELEFDVENSAVLGPDEKARLRTRLGRRLSSAGRVRVVAQRWRSRARNLEDARERLAALLAAALAEPKPRRATRVPARARVRRVEAKRRQATVKRQRRPLHGADDGD